MKNLVRSRSRAVKLLRAGVVAVSAFSCAARATRANDSKLVLSPSSGTINVLAGGLSTTLNLTVTNTALDRSSSPGAFTNVLSPSSLASYAVTSPAGATPGNVAISYDSGIVAGVSTQTLTDTITNTSNPGDSQALGNKLAHVTINVGGATADNSDSFNSYGPQLMAVIRHGGAYGGVPFNSFEGHSQIFSQVVGTSGSGGSDANNHGLGGTASLQGGTNMGANGGGTATISMQWRTRLATETALASDVMNLSGLEINGSQTDVFVFHMSYNPALLGGNELTLAHNKLIYPVSLGPDGNVNAVSLNTGNVVTGPLDNRYGYVGSLAAFGLDPNVSHPGAGTGDYSYYMGFWGVDTSAHEIWAILDHSGSFAVAPEPSMLSVAGLGTVALALRRRRR